VVVACHSENDDIKPGTLSSMIRQPRLPKRAFGG
jgi:predicted RNA binding protein YcfA (HicA-like mRNA interferase family)